MASTYWFMGLPFDLVSVNDVTERIRSSAASSSQLVLVTPNLDFLSMARTDAEFRDTVFRSQLSVVDGMPLVWLGRLLGVPFPERVSGSDVFEALRVSSTERLGVCFLGGEDTSAEEASAVLNSAGGSVFGAGALNPGHGDIESLGRPEVLEAVNSSKAQFLVVALGARKGQLWIDRYAGDLNIPVVSHLGAVVNYTAGRLSRAPVWMRRSGAEWVWRMVHEPHLARRYAGDALFLIRELATAGLALMIWRAWRKLTRAKVTFEAKLLPDSGRLLLSGVLDASTAHLLEQHVAGIEAVTDLSIVLDDLHYLDAAGIGMLYSLCYRRPDGPNVTLTGGSPTLRRLLRLYRAESLLHEDSAPLPGLGTPAFDGALSAEVLPPVADEGLSRTPVSAGGQRS